MLSRSEAGQRRKKEQHYEGRRQQNPRSEAHSRYLKDREQEGEHHRETQDSCAGQIPQDFAGPVRMLKVSGLFVF